MAFTDYCRACDQDFGSVKAFDMHRVGTHEYSYSEGLQMTPPGKMAADAYLSGR